MFTLHSWLGNNVGNIMIDPMMVSFIKKKRLIHYRDVTISQQNHEPSLLKIQEPQVA